MPLKILFCLLVICLSFSAQAEAQIKQAKVKLKTAKQVKIPRSIFFDDFKFKKSDTNKFKDINYGVALSYTDKQHPDVSVSHYIYPMTNAQVSVEYLLSFEFELLKQQISRVNQHKGLEALLLQEKSVKLETVNSLYAKHNLVNEQADMISETYLTHDNFHYIKVRISFPRHQAKTYTPMSQELARALILNTTVKEHKNTSIKISLTTPDDVEDEGMRSVIISNQLTYLISTLSLLEPNNLFLTYEQQASIAKKMAEISASMIADEGRVTGVLYFNDIDDAGFLNEFVWIKMRQAHWSLPEGLQLEAFETWATEQQGKVLPFSPNAGRLVIYFD